MWIRFSQDFSCRRCPRRDSPQTPQAEGVSSVECWQEMEVRISVLLWRLASCLKNPVPSQQLLRAILPCRPPTRSRIAPLAATDDATTSADGSSFAGGSRNGELGRGDTSSGQVKKEAGIAGVVRPCREVRVRRPARKKPNAALCPKQRIIALAGVSRMPRPACEICSGRRGSRG
jgi:hypothetical protein